MNLLEPGKTRWKPSVGEEHGPGKTQQKTQQKNKVKTQVDERVDGAKERSRKPTVSARRLRRFRREKKWRRIEGRVRGNDWLLFSFSFLLSLSLYFSLVGVDSHATRPSLKDATAHIIEWKRTKQKKRRPTRPKMMKCGVASGALFALSFFLSFFPSFLPSFLPRAFGPPFERSARYSRTFQRLDLVKTREIHWKPRRIVESENSVKLSKVNR